MNNKKDIERLYRERFKDYQSSPDKDLWPDIELRLNQGKRKRRGILPLWKRLAGIAALLTLLISGALYYNSQKNSDVLLTPEISESNTQTPANTSSSSNNNSEVTAPTLVPDMPTNRNNQAAVPGIYTKNSGVAEAENQTPKPVFGSEPNNEKLPETTFFPQTKALLEQYAKLQLIAPVYDSSEATVAEKAIAVSSKTSPENNLFAALENKEEDIANTNEKSQRWAVSPQMGPVYFNSLNGGSPIDAQFNDNSKQGNINMSYGLNVAYNVNKRWSVRTGLNKLDIGYNTNGVELSADQNANLIRNINYRQDSPFVAITDSKSGTKVPSNSEVSSRTPVYNGDLSQQLGYLEIPFEVKYRIIDHKLGLNFIGGFSSMFLTNNELGLNSSTLNTEIGAARNVNNFNMSTNIGIGLDYQFTKQMMFNLEPMFKYQLNTFSGDNGGFSPYILGVYTGFSFRF